MDGQQAGGTDNQQKHRLTFPFTFSRLAEFAA